jgi:hypothetical protein
MNDEFRTTDIVLAAFLRLNSQSMSRIEKIGTKGTFVFKNVPPEMVLAFDLGNAQVEPIAFNNMIKQLTTSVRRM